MSRVDIFGPPAEVRSGQRFDAERARSSYALTAFLVSMRDPVVRQNFANDEHGFLEKCGLTDEQQSLVLNRDYKGIIEHGASIYALAKAAGALGTTLLEIGAAAKGMSAQEFIAHKRATQGTL